MDEVTLFDIEEGFIARRRRTRSHYNDTARYVKWGEGVLKKVIAKERSD